MTLKLRPTGLGSGIDKDRPDYTVFTGEWEVGRIYETRGGPDNLRWFWSLTVNGPMTRSDCVAGGSQDAISEKLGRMEGVGEAGGGCLSVAQGAGPPALPRISASARARTRLGVASTARVGLAPYRAGNEAPRD